MHNSEEGVGGGDSVGNVIFPSSSTGEAGADLMNSGGVNVGKLTGTWVKAGFSVRFSNTFRRGIVPITIGVEASRREDNPEGKMLNCTSKIYSFINPPKFKVYSNNN